MPPEVMEKDKSRPEPAPEKELNLTERDVSLAARMEEETRGPGGEPAADGADQAEEAADWGELAKEVGLEEDADPREILKEYVALRDGKPKLQTYESLDAEAKRLGYEDGEHLLEAMRKYDPKAAKPAAQTQPAVKPADTPPAVNFAEAFKGYNEESVKFAQTLWDLLDKHPALGNKGELEQHGEALYRVAGDMYYLDLKDQLRDQNVKLDVSKRKLLDIADDYGLFAKANGRNPLAMAYGILKTENQKPNPTTNGRVSGIDKAKSLEKPGGQKSPSERVPIGPDGEPDWSKMTAEQMHKVVEKLPYK